MVRIYYCAGTTANMTDPTFPTTILPDQIVALERIERDAIADLYAAASPDVAHRFGLQHRRIDDGIWSVSRVLDHIMFCRLQGLGVENAARAEAVDDAITSFETANVKNWIIQLAPGADVLARLLAARRFERHPRAWAKFVVPVSRSARLMYVTRPPLARSRPPRSVCRQPLLRGSAPSSAGRTSGPSWHSRAKRPSPAARFSLRMEPPGWVLRVPLPHIAVRARRVKSWPLASLPRATPGQS
jgi:hypothetical protein